jgi:hypothetical protein
MYTFPARVKKTELLIIGSHDVEDSHRTHLVLKQIDCFFTYAAKQLNFEGRFILSTRAILSRGTLRSIALAIILCS